MSKRIRRFLCLTGLVGLLSSAVWAVDVDAALDAAKKPKKDADRTEVAETAKAAQADMQKRIDEMDAERKRRREALVDKFIDRSALGGGSSSGDTNPGASKGIVGSGVRTFVCEYKCTNAKFTESDKTTMSIRVRASDKGAAEGMTIRHGKDTCYQQAQRVWDTGSHRCRPQ